MGYNRESVAEYLEAHEDRGAKLTPTLAHEFHDLAREYGAYDWACSACATTFEWDAIDWDGESSDPPFCPACAEGGDLVTLSGPDPANQLE